MIKEYIETISEFNTNMGEVFKFIKTTWNILTHPALMFSFIESSSFTICLILVCVAVIAYAIGYEKANKWISGSIVGFIIIKMIGAVI